MLSVRLFLILLSAVSAVAVEPLLRDPDAGLGAEVRWEKFKGSFQKAYKDEPEETARFGIFKANLARIAEHNAKNLPHWFGVNQFADLTKQEFKAATKCYRSGINGKKGKTPSDASAPRQETVRRRLAEGAEPLADSVDWRTEGKVTPVKNQGQCGSCWSFSATGAMESRAAIAGGELVELSEQELVDCDNPPNQGCNGGSMIDAFEYAQEHGGMCSEDSYKYEAKDDKAQCDSKRDACGTKLDKPDSFDDVDSDCSSCLEREIAKGPVSIAIEADEDNFQLYAGGVLTTACGAAIDHGVLAVGYGSEGGNDFWLVKNSWGDTWGEAGYIKLCRNCDKNMGSGQCGILSQPCFPTY